MLFIYYTKKLAIYQCCCVLWAAFKVCYKAQAAWGIVCKDTASSDMFLPRLAFSGVP